MYNLFRVCLFGGVLFGLCGVVFANGYMQLKSPSGQVISAKPINLYGEKVRIQMQDGREMNVALEMFAADSAKQLKDWAIQHLAKNDLLFESEVKRKEKVTRKYEKDVPLTGGGVSKGALKIKEIDGFYEIVLTNRSDFDLKGLRLEYRVFSEQDSQAKKDRHDVRYTRDQGNVELSIPNRQMFECSTDPIELFETELGKGIVWSGGGDLKADAEMIGVWFRVYRGEDILHEYCRPTMLKEREDW